LEKEVSLCGIFTECSVKYYVGIRLKKKIVSGMIRWDFGEWQWAYRVNFVHIKLLKAIIRQEPFSNMDRNGACKYKSCRSHQPGQGGYTGNSIPCQLEITLPESLWKFKQNIGQEKSSTSAQWFFSFFPSEPCGISYLDTAQLGSLEQSCPNRKVAQNNLQYIFRR